MYEHTAEIRRSEEVLREAREELGVEIFGPEQYAILNTELGDAYRVTGITDAKEYEAILADQESTIIGVEDKIVFPLLADIKYEKGYDAEKCRALTGSEKVQLLATPLESILDCQVEIGVTPQERKPIIVECAEEVTEAYQRQLPITLEAIGLGSYEVREFEDLENKDDTRKHASLELWQVRFGAPEGGWPETNIQPTEKSTYEISGRELRQNPTLADELWQLYKSRFLELGTNHPVSMEDSREFFDHHILHGETNTVIKFDNEGHVACFAYYTRDLNRCSWLRPSTISQLQNEAMQQGDALAYLYAVVSNGNGVHAIDVMKSIYQTPVKGNEQMTQAFAYEVTNHSARYMLRMVDFTRTLSGVTPLGPQQKLAAQRYFWLQPTGE